MTAGGVIVPDDRSSRGERPDGAPGWQLTSAYTAAVVAGVILLALGVLAGRADLALIGVPGLLAAAWARSGRPGTVAGPGPGSGSVAEAGAEAEAGAAAEPRGTLREPEGSAAAGELTATLHVAPGAADVVHLRIAAAGHRTTEVTLAARATPARDVPLRLSSVRTGPQDTFAVDLRGSLHATWEQEPVQVGGTRRLVLPAAAPLGRLPLPQRLRGLTGPHSSRRLGDGAELRDIHPFTPGDRRRRIDWRTTARRSPDLDTLYVRRTYATAEATAVLVVDSRDDVGPDLHTWRGYGTLRVDEPTSLDLARHAAASVARALVEGGDRVGLEDLARRRRPLPPASGRRHLRRIVHGLALAHPKDRASVHRVRPPQVPADAIVYLFTTVLDDEPLHLVRTWRTKGHPVVVIDTLPDVHPVTESHLRIAWRIARLERDDRLAALTGEGVPVIRWAGSARDQAAIRFETLARAAERHVPGRTGTP
ncbi:DUF58 domain-containing protein [Promicromonospora sp. NPDC050262]|uniref:DUF58 domain-containing protein n=1 Tax=Promicromonospora sp. NPDC050262 TaxID=3155036 RepID=UPI0033CC38BE